ncbi:MAG: flagellar hook-associated protein FlgK [Gammaproteobacteria bacterium]
MADILNTSLSGLRAYQTALATTSHNISNVGTEGYSRQRVELSARPPQQFGSNQIGQGVDISNVSRIFDSFVIESIRDFSSSSSRLSMFESFAIRTENLIADEQGNLIPALESFFSALSDVSNDPSSTAPRIGLIERAENLQQRFSSLSNNLLDLQQEVDNQLNFVVTDINSIAQEIARINEAINKVSSVDYQPPDLLDQRDQLLKQLSEKVSVNTVVQNDGTLNVLIGTGQLLISGANVLTLAVTADSAQPDRRSVLLQSSSGSVDITNTLNGGEVGGLLDFSNTMLDDAQNRLGRMAIALSETFNAQNIKGYDLNGDLGTNFFSTVGTGNLQGIFGADYRANGFDDADAVSFQLDFDGVSLAVNVPAIAPADTNDVIAQNILDAIGTAAAVAANPDGSYTVPGTTTGVSMTFRLQSANNLDGSFIEFETTGGPSATVNNLQISGLTDGTADDLVMQTRLIGSSSTQVDTAFINATNTVTYRGPSNGTFPNLGNTGSGVVNFSITDITQLTVSDYQIDYDGANYNVLRLSDNTTVASGAGPFNVDGMSITLGGIANVGDSFYLRPSRLGALSFQSLISDPADIVAASPLRSSSTPANLGNISISQATVTDITDGDVLRTVDIVFDAANPSNTFDVVDRATGSVLQNDVVYTEGMLVSQNGWQVQITGNPELGDTLTVRQNTGAATDNRNALLLVALQNTPFMDSNTSTYQHAYNTLTTQVGTVTQQIKINLQVEENLLGAAIEEREMVSGVNLDEEAADLIRFQQAYQALSRIIQTSQQLFQSLLDSV